MEKGIPHESLDYSMSEGMSTRIRECLQCIGTGNSNAVQITRKSDGFLWHCFRCSLTGFVPDISASPSQVQQIIDQASKEKVDTRPERVTLPEDFSTTIPATALVQMYDLGITDRDLERHDIGWSRSHGRIIVPVYQYGKGPSGWAKKLVGVLGRKLDTDEESKPKWWSVRQRDIKHPRFTSIPEKIVHEKLVVFVEDVFSAIKVGNTGRICQALLTTYMPYELYPKLKGWNVIVWLDSDAYGKAVKYVAQLGANGITARAIHTTKDPKAYEPDEIEREITNNGRTKS